MTRGVAALAALLAATLVLATGAQANELVTIEIPAAHGEVPADWLPYPGPPRANVLLPDGYDPARRYPLVLNLGGLGGDYQAATFGTSLHVNAIVVTPEVYNGWYVDWWNEGRRGDPAWESYQLDQVLPTIRARYPIRRGRRWHAVVGISMGGLGAAYLGGRLPGYFGTVATLSGFVDPQYFGAVTGEVMGLVSQPGNGSLYAVYGPPDGFYAAGHSPARLVANLAHTRIFQSHRHGHPDARRAHRPGQRRAGGGAGGRDHLPDEPAVPGHGRGRGPGRHLRRHPGGHTAKNFSSEIKAMFAWGLFRRPVATHPRTWTNDTVADGRAPVGRPLPVRCAARPRRALRARRPVAVDRRRRIRGHDPDRRLVRGASEDAHGDPGQFATDARESPIFGGPYSRTLVVVHQPLR